MSKLQLSKCEKMDMPLLALVAESAQCIDYLKELGWEHDDAAYHVYVLLAIVMEGSNG